MSDANSLILDLSMESALARKFTHARVGYFDDCFELLPHFLLLVLQLLELGELLVVQTHELEHCVAFGDVWVLDQVRDEVLVTPPSEFSRFYGSVRAFSARGSPF